MKRATILFVLVLSSLAPGCRSSRTASVASEHRAECPVCVHEGDLACVEVDVAADTPHLEYEGKTLYFCSAECCAEFERHPGRYCSCIH